MQVLLNIPEGYFEDECSPTFAYKERAKIEKQYNLRPQDNVKVVNIGPGADWLVLLTTFTATSWTLFQLPGIIKKSLEGWQWLIDKLKGYKKNKQLISLDLDAAGMLAIDYLGEKYGEDSFFNLMDAHCFKIQDLSGMYPGDEGILAAHPHNYYVFTFNIAARILVVSVRSSGEIREIEAFSDMPYGLWDVKE